jgi:hypothetical protein
MKWHCAKRHYTIAFGGYVSGFSQLTFNSFGEWLFDRVFGHGSERFRQWLVRKGWVDAETEGGIAFWRWDPWNAKIAKELERERWEAKRKSALNGWA